MKKSGFIAIIGRPNAGKSTLLNRILGTELSIVTPKAQTTREKVLGILTERRGQIVFVDTPGIHRAKKAGINEFMVQQAQEALEAPNLVWYLVDPFSGTEHEQEVLGLLAETQSRIFLVFNKVDIRQRRTQPDELAKFEQQLLEAARKSRIAFDQIHRISARKGAQVNDLLEESWKLLPEGPQYYPDDEQVSDRPVRFFVAEKIREQLFLQLGQELPYSCAVQIENFNENAKPLRIEAIIHVERDSQKGMVIGKSGTKIKAIGQAARIEIEKFLGEQVFLGLKVDVWKDWSRDAESLKRLGYLLPAKSK